MTTPWTRPRTSDDIDDSYIHFNLGQLEDTDGELRIPLRMSKVPPSLSFLGFGSKLPHQCSRLHIPMTHITPGTRTRNGTSTANRGKAMLPTYTGACGCAGVRLCKPFKEEEEGEEERRMTANVSREGQRLLVERSRRAFNYMVCTCATHTYPQRGTGLPHNCLQFDSMGRRTIERRF